MKRRELLRLGKRGQLVRVVEATSHGAPVYRVLYRKVTGTPAVADYPRTRQGRLDALAFADGAYQQMTRPPASTRERLTVAQLFPRFAEERFSGLAASTQRLYRDSWRHWELFAGPHLPAEDAGRETMARLRTTLERDGYAPSYIQKIITDVKHIYRWAADARLTAPSDVERYRLRFRPEDVPESPAEYRQDDFLALLAALPLEGRHWRAHAAIALCGRQGMRQHSVLHLRWEDVDFEAGTITWQKRWMKQRREIVQPMRRHSREVLTYLAQHRQNGPWVFWSARRANQPYTIQGLWAAIEGAEERAGVAKVARRAGHGLRRLLAGQINELTGDAKLAMDAIGDRDERQIGRYVKRREDRVAEAFAALDESEMGAVSPAAVGESANLLSDKG